MFVARAPGKVVALGEYAVLDGAPAVVLALDRYVEAAVGPSPDGACRLTMRAAEVVERQFAPGEPSGAPLIDLVTAAVDPRLAWVATIDSQALFAGSSKLGLGSSAAVLCAWAGAFGAFARSRGVAGAATASRRAHRAAPTVPGRQGQWSRRGGFVHGRGDYLQLGSVPVLPQIGSVRLPNSVGFAGIFAGRSASTPGLVAHYRAWHRARPREAAALVGGLTALAEAGVKPFGAATPRRGSKRSRPMAAACRTWVTRSVRRSSRPSIVRSTPRHGATASRTRSAGPGAATLGSPARTTGEGSRLSGNRLGIGVFE